MRISDWSSDVCSSDLLDCMIVLQPPVETAPSGHGIENHFPNRDAQRASRSLPSPLGRLGGEPQFEPPVRETGGGAGGFERRSEERRVGKEWVGTGRFGWSPYP